jgi:hypothetical protein
MQIERVKQNAAQSDRLRCERIVRIRIANEGRLVGLQS